ncbi:hypothetical protein [Aggregatilinea lenta]|uniref:hypothetical protein n=1 Tax=Aggregatilinea lenta TaxID=913108 RepID=UPI000E5B592C|nr:hypothetical protein [Aggregatilinea lenta]
MNSKVSSQPDPLKRHMLLRAEQLSKRHPYAIKHNLPDGWWYAVLALCPTAPKSVHPRIVKLPLSAINVIQPEGMVLDQDVIDDWAYVMQTGDTSKLKPYSLFADMTYLGEGERGRACADIVEAHCFAHDAVAAVGQNRDGMWIFHTLYDFSTDLTYRKPISKLFENDSPREAKNERAMETAFAKRLRRAGHAVERQVPCAAGVADIVTEEAVYELKGQLSRSNFFTAVGQVLLYRQAINPALRPVVVGRTASGEHLDPLIRYAEALGVEVLILGEG